jgi:hypothetical protein
MRVLVVPSALVAVTAAMLMGCSMLPRISSDDGANRSSAIQAIAPEFAEKSGGSSLYVAVYNVVFRINLTRPHRLAEQSGTGYSFSVDRKHNLYTVDETNVVRVYDSKLTTLKRTFSFEGSESGKAVVIAGRRMRVPSARRSSCSRRARTGTLRLSGRCQVSATSTIWLSALTEICT